MTVPIDAKVLPTYSLDGISQRGGLGAEGDVGDVVTQEPRIELCTHCGVPMNAPGHSGHYESAAVTNRKNVIDKPPPSQPRILEKFKE